MMRKNMTRGIAAGALVLAMGLPIGAYAAPGDDWAPGAGDCEMSEEVRAAFENNEELQALREARQAEAAQSREQYREKVEAQLEGDALAWYQENGAGQNARQGEGAGQQAGEGAGGQYREGGGAGVRAQDCLDD